MRRCKVTTRGFLIVRWVLLAIGVGLVLLLLNQTVFFAWQTAAPEGNRHPELMAHFATRSLAAAAAVVAVTGVIFANVRKGLPYVSSAYTWLVLVFAFAVYFAPEVVKTIEQDKCLDGGGSWQFHKCILE